VKITEVMRKGVCLEIPLKVKLRTNQVHDEEVCKDNAGTEHAGQQHVGLPLLPAETLVDSEHQVQTLSYKGQ
jgi:hypothetical protein